MQFQAQPITDHGDTHHKNPTVQDEVYGELRRSLMTGVYVPGEKVSLRALAEQMGTSMMPVREAINRLVAERAFEVFCHCDPLPLPEHAHDHFGDFKYLGTKHMALTTPAAAAPPPPA